MFHYSKFIYWGSKGRRLRKKPAQTKEITSAVILNAITNDLKKGVIPRMSDRLMRRMKIVDLRKVVKVTNDKKILAKYKTRPLRRRIIAFEFKMHKRIILKTMAKGKLPKLGFFIVKLDHRQLIDLYNAIMSGAVSMQAELNQSRNSNTTEGKKLYKDFLQIEKDIVDQKIALYSKQEA